MYARGARKGDNVRAKRVNPGNAKLGGGDILGGGHLLESIHDSQVVLQVLGLEAGEVATVITLWDILNLLNSAGEQALSDRANNSGILVSCGV
jgi:hypothetical protein